MKVCKCLQPKRTKNAADGVDFYVCAKSKGGCGEEIVDEKHVIIKLNQPIDFIITNINLSDVKADDFDGLPSFMSSPAHMPHNGPCQYGGCGLPGELSRQNTQYVDDDSNWGTFCPDHQKMVDEHWDEMWKDYWSGRL